MDTGPQSMPKFNDATITPQEKRDIISYVKYLEETPAPGGLTLGNIGPVSEALVAWIVGIAGLIGCAVWLGARSDRKSTRLNSSHVANSYAVYCVKKKNKK